MRYVSRAGTLWKETSCKLTRYRPCLVSSIDTLGTWPWIPWDWDVGMGDREAHSFSSSKQTFFLPRVLYLQKNSYKLEWRSGPNFSRINGNMSYSYISLMLPGILNGFLWLQEMFHYSICATQPTQNIGTGPVGKFSTWWQCLSL